MYGKSFESKYTGSLMGSGFNVFAVWDYITTNTHFGVIELNPKLVAFTLAGNMEGAEEQVKSAIEFLCAPDPNSRTKTEGGRRLIREGQFQYRVVNWEIYQRIRNDKDRRDYNRVKQAEYRERKKKKIGPVPTVREQMAEKAHREGDDELAARIMEDGLPEGHEENNGQPEGDGII